MNKVTKEQMDYMFEKLVNDLVKEKKDDSSRSNGDNITNTINRINNCRRRNVEPCNI